MVYNLERTLDNIEKKGIERGIERGENKKAIEVARRMLKKGFEIEEILEITDLDEEKVLKLKEEIDKSKH
jgi:predicted transposase/invertase (TIGR01784 family)